MKKTIRKSILAVVLTAISFSATAQQVNTLYFLENAPVRQYINPAFTPICNFYLSLPVIGYTSVWAGNNSLTASDIVFNNAEGQAITFLHPDADSQQFMKSLRKTTLIDVDLQTNLLSFGFRFKDYNYIHVAINERIETGVSLPKDMFGLILDGGMKDLTGGDNIFNFTSLGVNALAYTEVGVGYTREINEHWSVGGKLKFLLGTGYVGATNKNLGVNLRADQWDVYGNGDLYMAAPLVKMPERMPSFDEFQNADSLFGIKDIDMSRDWKKLLKPAGYGGAIDLGFTYKPIEQLAITASVTDLGFITWRGGKYNYNIDGTFDGVGEIKYNDYVNSEGKFDGDILMDTISTRFKYFYENMLTSDNSSDHFTRMISAKLNVGFDANFWDNRVGVGIYSRTRFFNKQVYEEVTLGAAFRPVHWFNIAASYSFINGKWHTIGGALSLITYEGLGFFVAADYIPLSYAKVDAGGKSRNLIPYKSSGLNLAFGMNIVIGHKRDKDHDGVKDKYDLCPDTPRKVEVDKDGCPLDTDGDGVPDYKDRCNDTPAGTPVDEFGCSPDSDGDGVPDYKDECPNTPKAARGRVDEKGCELDTDGDGVPDYKDECPTIPGSKDNHGCPTVKKEVRNLLKQAMQGIQFETGKSNIKKTSHPLLNQIANVFIDNPTYKVEVQGHTDNVGKPEFNQDLSEKRAQAVRKYLIDAGVPEEQLTAHGYGDTMPIASNSTASGRAKNRRVEFIISFEEVSYEEVNDRVQPQDSTATTTTAE